MSINYPPKFTFWFILSDRAFSAWVALGAPSISLAWTPVTDMVWVSQSLGSFTGWSSPAWTMLRRAPRLLAFMLCFAVLKFLMILSLNLRFVSKVYGTIKYMHEQRRHVQYLCLPPFLLPHSHIIFTLLMECFPWHAFLVPIWSLTEFHQNSVLLVTSKTKWRC